jgi:DNA (cytosine-5)-methyltransferase 1
MPRRQADSSHKLIDLFCGAGGLTLGFTQAFGQKFKSIWADDLDPQAAETYSSNFGSHCSVGNIVTILEDPSTRIPKVDVVIGGPPCQGFSLLDKNLLSGPAGVMNGRTVLTRTRIPTARPPSAWRNIAGPRSIIHKP